MTSRLSMGYHLNNDARDFLGPELPNLRETIGSIRDVSRAEISAYLSTHVQKYPSVRIGIVGQLGDIEQALDLIVSSLGMPEFVDQPHRDYTIPALLNRAFGVVNKTSPTTADAYRLVKRIYLREGIKPVSLSGGTLAIDRGYI